VRLPYSRLFADTAALAAPARCAKHTEMPLFKAPCQRAGQGLRSNHHDGEECTCRMLERVLHGLAGTAPLYGTFSGTCCSELSTTLKGRTTTHCR
jgi:hypothetical protein